MEGETMRVMYEPWFVKYKVDVVFAGHVHAYERSVRYQQLFKLIMSLLTIDSDNSELFWNQERVSNIAYNVVNGICTPVKDKSAPVYITIGDGGNLEGLATR